MKAIGTILVCLLAVSFAFGQNTGATPPQWWGSSTAPSTTLGTVQTDIDSIEGALYGNVGNQWGTAALPANGVAIDEVIRYISDAVAGANGLNKWSEPTEIVINFDAAGAWEDSANTHEVLNVTGDVEIEMAIACSTNVSSESSDSIWFFLGESGATGYRMFSALGEDIDAGENLIPVNYSGRGYVWSAASLTTSAGGLIRFTSHMGKDVGYDIDDDAFTGGIITIWYRWRPLSTGGSVSSGVGGSL